MFIICRLLSNPITKTYQSHHYASTYTRCVPIPLIPIPEPSVSYHRRSSFPAVVRLRLSSTMEKPLSTSVETFKASMAIRTTYIRFIIFWRGETGLFFIAISLYFPIGRPPRHGRGLPCKQKCLGTLAAGRQSLSGAAAFMLTVMASIMRE